MGPLLKALLLALLALLASRAAAQTGVEVPPAGTSPAVASPSRAGVPAGDQGWGSTAPGRLDADVIPEAAYAAPPVEPYAAPPVEPVDRPPRRLVINLRHRDAHRGTGYRTLGEADRSERVQTIEGHPAFIRSGESVPVPTWQAYGGGPLPFVERGIAYRDAVSGFYVTPRLAGDEVVLEIARHAVQAGPGDPPVFAGQEVAATLRVRPGEWVTLGSVSGSAVQNRRGITGHYATRRASDTTIEVMVEVLPDR